jgi:nicotinamide mononucleotide transporter
MNSLTAIYSQIPFTAIAIIFGILGVVLTIRENIFCWPAALVSTVAAAIDFYKVSLFGDMALQVFYFGAGVYGWIYWKQNRSAVFAVSYLHRRWIPFLIIATGAQWFVYYFLLKYFNGARPFLDALLTAASLTTTYMMTKKWVENWLLWVIIDGTYILLYFLTGLYWYGLLYFIFALTAYYGWIRWKKTASLK